MTDPRPPQIRAYHPRRDRRNQNVVLGYCIHTDAKEGVPYYQSDTPPQGEFVLGRGVYYATGYTPDHALGLPGSPEEFLKTPEVGSGGRGDNSAPGHPGGRPRSKPACPLCQGSVNFERLGYWPGWALGISPSYWPQLCDYIRERDGHRCTECGAEEATGVHHIRPKEEGGVDAARNLTTLCSRCHNAAHDPESEAWHRIRERQAEYVVAIPAGRGGR